MLTLSSPLESFSSSLSFCVLPAERKFQATTIRGGVGALGSMARLDETGKLEETGRRSEVLGSPGGSMARLDETGRKDAEGQKSWKR